MSKRARREPPTAERRRLLGDARRLALARGADLVALVEAGCDPNGRNAHGETVLEWKCFHNRYDDVRELVRLGARPAAHAFLDLVTNAWFDPDLRVDPEAFVALALATTEIERRSFAPFFAGFVYEFLEYFERVVFSIDRRRALFVFLVDCFSFSDVASHAFVSDRLAFFERACVPDFVQDEFDGEFELRRMRFVSVFCGCDPFVSELF